MPWDSYDMATIQSLITNCEFLEKELAQLKEIEARARQSLKESEDRRCGIAQVLEDEGPRVPRDIMQKLWEVNGNPVGEKLDEDKADQEQEVHSATGIYGVIVDGGISVKGKVKGYDHLLTDKEIVSEISKGPYPWNQDKDRRIQELLESNNQLLERARKAERELFVTQSFVKNFICPEGGRVVKHARTHDKYVVEREVKTKVEEGGQWVHGILYRSLKDQESYVRLYDSFYQSFLPVDLKTEKD